MDFDSSLTGGPANDDPSFIVVGIGVCAQSHSSLVELLSHTIIDGLAFVVVGRLPEGKTGELVERLAAETSFDVVLLKEGMPLEPKRVYVCPPDASLTLVDGHALLTPAPDAEPPPLPIDVAFRSLAREYGARTAGVLLEGCRPDGTAGLAAIRGEAGITFVEDASSAGAEETAVSEADLALPAREIGAELVHIAHHRGLGGPARSGLKDVTQQELQRVFAIIKSGFGLDLASYKLSTILRRLERRMALAKHERVADYLKLLQSSAQERTALYKDLLIRVTSFFRDEAPYAALTQSVFPRLFATKRPGSAIRIWSAGCATGEETYSLAITLFEYLGDRAGDYRLQLFGTDIEGDSIHFARRAVYPPSISLDVSPERLRRFFVQRDGQYQVSRRVRDSVVFAEHNLTKDAPFSRIDLVCCRNVLIYLQAPAQKQVFRTLHYALNPDGVLVLGNSETVGDSDLFAVLDKKTRVYLKRNVAPVANFEMTSSSPAVASSIDTPRAAPAPQTASVQQMAERKILERYGPPGVLVNENFEILHFRGRTGPYLDPAPGHATLNLLKLARTDLQGPLRTLLGRVFAEKRPTRSELIRRRAGQSGDLRLELIPIQDGDGRHCALVLFDETDATVAEAGAEHLPEETGITRLQELEDELSSMRNHLQRTIEELETSNEELKSSNEELQSSNEELQSTNEELETSKEELQSTNEELTTVNDELQERMLELSTVNDDLNNILSSVESPTLLVDLDCRIRHYSRAAERLLSLVPADVGRTLSQLRDFFPGLDVDRICHDTVQHITPWEGQATSRDGRHFLLRSVPYHTADHAIRGVVILFSELASAGK